MKAKLVLFLLLVFLINLDFAFPQMSLQWAKKFSGDGGINYNDKPRGTAIDSRGNLIITGSSFDYENTAYFYITIKYNPDGNILWTKRLDTSSVAGTPYGITVDNNDNIYISGGGGRFTVIKYSAIGEIKWVVHETSPVDGIIGNSIISDINGNLYVTGSCAIGADVSCLTVKYDSNGIRQWYSIYNHPSNNSDYFDKIMLDNENNVYIIGYTYVSGGGTIATTLKYNNTGNLLWTALYDDADYEDYVKDIAVDKNSNVYVTGSSDINYSQKDYNFFTIRYDSNGDSVWVRKFDGPGTGYDRSIDMPYSLKLDSENNIIVTGKSQEVDGDNDVRIIKYSSGGNEIWNRRFDFNSLSNDNAYAMEVDEQNSIYLAGRTNNDYLILKYNSNGNILWYHNYNGIGNGSDFSSFINLDQLGNPVITGYSNQGTTSEDYLSIKYDTLGSMLWTRSYSTPSVSNDNGNSLDADDKGNVVVTGKTESLNNKIELITSKYNSYGNLVWKKTYNNLNSIYNEGIDIVVDQLGNSFVTGYTTTSEQHKRLIALKYDSSGVLGWSSIYSGLVDGITIPKKIMLDGNNNVYVCGLTLVNGQGYDLLVVKYNSLNGNILWQKTFNNSNYNGNEEGLDICLDSENNILITGYTTVSSNNTDYLVVKFDENGNLMWSRTYNKLLSDVAYSVKSDILGNIYITGRTYEALSLPPHYFNIESYTATLKFDANGNVKWTSTNGTSCFNCFSENSAYELVLDDESNVYVTGESTGKYKTIKYDSLGNILWIRYYNGSYPNHSKATNIVLDNESNIFISGKAPSSQYNTDIASLKYNNATGNQDWIHTYSNNENRDDIISRMIIDSIGSIFITGYSNSIAAGNDILILKYSSSTIGISSNNFIKNNYSLSQNYPNPFNPTTIISYSIIENVFVKLKLYDVLGNEIATLVNEKQNAGSYNYQFSAVNYQLSSGVYFYKLEAGDFVETKRMILLK